MLLFQNMRKPHVILYCIMQAAAPLEKVRGRRCDLAKRLDFERLKCPVGSVAGVNMLALSRGPDVWAGLQGLLGTRRKQEQSLWIRKESERPLRQCGRPVRGWKRCEREGLNITGKGCP